MISLQLSLFSGCRCPQLHFVLCRYLSQRRPLSTIRKVGLLFPFSFFFLVRWVLEEILFVLGNESDLHLLFKVVFNFL